MDIDALLNDAIALQAKSAELEKRITVLENMVKGSKKLDEFYGVTPGHDWMATTSPARAEPPRHVIVQDGNILDALSKASRHAPHCTLFYFAGNLYRNIGDLWYLLKPFELPKKRIA